MISANTFDTRFFKILSIANLIGAFSNVYVASIIYVSGAYWSLISPVFCIIFFLWNYLYLKKNPKKVKFSFRIAAIVLALEVTYHTYLFSWESGFYFFYLVLPAIFLMNFKWPKGWSLLYGTIFGSVFITKLIWFYNKPPAVNVSNEFISIVRDLNVSVFLIIIFITLIFFQFIVKDKDEKLEYANQMFKEKNLEARRQRDLAEKQKALVEEKNNEILDSLNYAKRLQDAIMPTNRAIQKGFQNSFLFYLPKDIIAGDFYWMEVVPNTNQILFAVADCTGHGVPGAMVSVVCANALNRAYREFGLVDPGELLEKTREFVVESFEKGGERIRDGMDIGLIRIDVKSRELCFAGAHTPLYVVQKKLNLENKYISENGAYELIEIKGSKQPIGKYEHEHRFETNHVSLQEGDCVYLSTDGFPDQFGGPKGKKFKYASFKRLLLEIHEQDLINQNNAIQERFFEWKGDFEQVDDVCVFGLQV